MKVLITGANRGLGLEFCRQLVQRTVSPGEPHAVFATCRDPGTASQLAQLAASVKGALHIAPLDLEDERTLTELPSRLRELGLEGSGEDSPSLDLVVCNAGVYADAGRTFDQYHFDAFRRSFEVNTLGPFKVLKALAPFLRKKGTKVLQVTSLMGSIADNTSGGAAAYRSSKAALNMINKSFALDNANLISVVVHPGWVQTDMGGPHAEITPEVSVSGMLKVIDKADFKDSGKFFNYDGTTLPW